MNRRRVLATGSVGAMGAAALAIAGCGDDSSGGSTPGGSSAASGASPGASVAAGAGYPTKGFDKLTVEQMRTLFSGSKLKDLPGQKQGPKPGGQLNIIGTTPVSWDPASPSGSVLSSYMFAHNQLTQFKVNDWVKNPNFMEYEPVLAEALPEQPDNLTYTYKLRQGVKFQDVPPVSGREMTSDDVLNCVKAYQTAPAQAPLFAELDSVNALDKYTVQFKMKQPSAYFVHTFALPFYWIFPKEQTADQRAKTPVGTGGFILESQKNLGNYKFKKNPNYFRKDPRTNMQLPYLNSIEGIHYEAPAQWVSAYRSGQLDSLWPQDFKTWTDIMSEGKPASISQVTTPAPSAQAYVAMRLDKPPFKDKRVRQALSLLIDRKGLIDSLASGMAGLGYGQDWTYFGQEWPWTADQLGEYMSYDPKKANQLFDAAGVDPKSLDLEFLLTERGDFRYNVWIAVAAMLAKAGIKTKVNAPQDPAIWEQQFFSGNYKDMCGTALVGPGIDPDTFTYEAMYSKSPKNYFHINDPKLDDLCQKQRSILDKTERQGVLKQIMEYDLDIMTRLWTVTLYKINLRRAEDFNLTDTEAAWNPLGWGSCGLDTAWKLS